MAKSGSKDELQLQLEELEKKIEEAERKYARLGSRPGGTHVGHLADVKKRHTKLNQEVKAGDDRQWTQMKQTWHADLTSLLDAFDRAIRYGDEEFREGHK